MKRSSRWGAITLAVIVVAPALALAVAWGRVLVDGNTPSSVVGTVAQGRIEHAHVIPPWGPGYVTYSFIGAAAGRQYVDGRVRDTLLASFSVRPMAEGGRRSVMGETGWRSGGRFRPHRSHQNGMAVDVFMPVQTRSGEAATLATWPWNKFGYGVEFTSGARWATSAFSSRAWRPSCWRSMPRPVGAGSASGGSSSRPSSCRYCWRLHQPAGSARSRTAITRKAVWVRHDEHFHIDFEDAGAPWSGTRRWKPASRETAYLDRAIHEAVDLIETHRTRGEPERPAPSANH